MPLARWETRANLVIEPSQRTRHAQSLFGLSQMPSVEQIRNILALLAAEGLSSVFGSLQAVTLPGDDLFSHQSLLRLALLRLPYYDWIAFNEANGHVKYLEQLKRNGKTLDSII